MIDLKEVLEAFLKSEDFATGVLASTRAGFGGSGYSVELFPDGHWSVEWSQRIGNMYKSPGVIIGIPALSDDDWQAFVDMADGSQDNDSLGTDELEAIAQSMRDYLSDRAAEYGDVAAE